MDALLYPSFILGAHGAIAAILTAVPGLCVQLWDAVQAGDHKQALRAARQAAADLERDLPRQSAREREVLSGPHGPPGRRAARAHAGDVAGPGVAIQADPARALRSPQTGSYDARPQGAARIGITICLPPVKEDTVMADLRGEHASP